MSDCEGGGEPPALEGMDRDEALVRVAIGSNGTTIFRHTPGEGWSTRPFSPEMLEALADAQLGAWLARRSRSGEDIARMWRWLSPDMDEGELEEVVRENLAETLVAPCARCAAEVHQTDRGYLVWDADGEEWLMFCERHRPERYWREWPTGRRPGR